MIIQHDVLNNAKPKIFKGITVFNVISDWNQLLAYTQRINNLKTTRDWQHPITDTGSPTKERRDIRANTGDILLKNSILNKVRITGQGNSQKTATRKNILH